MNEQLLRDAPDPELDERRDDVRIAPGRFPATARVHRAASLDASAAERALARAARSSGAALPAHLRLRFERSLGADLSSVRVHTGEDSAAAAKRIGARAYAVGQDIHFAAGQYAPDDAFGVHLIAHEVAHTVQQAGGGAALQHKLEVSAPGDAHEREADRAADAMIAGLPASVTSGATIAARATAGATADAAAASSAQYPGGSGADPAGGGAAPAGAADGSAGADAKAGAKPIKVNVVVTPAAGDAIELDAQNYAELYKQVAARAQVDKEAGRCERGEIQVDDVTDGDNVVSISYTIPIKTSLPSWKQLASQPAEDQKKFTAWLASVAAHEKQHQALFTTGYAALKAGVTGPTRKDCDEQFDKIEAKVKQAQDDFDKASQPAPLAAPGGVTKVPPSGGTPAPKPANSNPAEES